jgi:hypothetical protein
VLRKHLLVSDDCLEVVAHARGMPPISLNNRGSKEVIPERSDARNDRLTPAVCEHGEGTTRRHCGCQSACGGRRVAVGVGGDDAADCLRYLIATKGRSMAARKLRGV